MEDPTVLFEMQDTSRSGMMWPFLVFEHVSQGSSLVSLDSDIKHCAVVLVEEVTPAKLIQMYHGRLAVTKQAPTSPHTLTEVLI